MILNDDVLSKVRTQSVTGKGKASVLGCQSQKPILACSAEKRYGDRNGNTNVWRLYLTGRYRGAELRTALKMRAFRPN